MKLVLIIMLLSNFSICMEPDKVVIHMPKEEQKEDINITVELPAPLKRENSDDKPDPKCCNSSNKVKLALIGLSATTITAVTTLIVQLYRCNN